MTSGSSGQPYAYKHVLARAQMVIKCQGREPRAVGGRRKSRNSTGYAARRSGFEFLLPGFLSSTGELNIIIPTL